MNILSFATPEAVGHHVGLLVDFALEHQEGDLRAQYFEALNKVQNLSLVAHDSPDFCFDLTEPWVHQMLTHFMRIPNVVDEHMCAQSEEAFIIDKMREALSMIEESSPDLVAVINFLVAAFVFGKREGFGGGSLGDQVGVVWINPDRVIDPVDFADKMVHEITHQCLFLYEMVHGIFSVSQDELSSAAFQVSVPLRPKRSKAESTT